MHGQRADIAARKEQGRNDEAVGGHHHAALLDGETGLIVALGQVGIVEATFEQLLDELGHGPAAAAVGHIDAALGIIQGTEGGSLGTGHEMKPAYEETQAPFLQIL